MEKTVDVIVNEICEKHSITRDQLINLPNNKKTTTAVRVEIIRAINKMANPDQITYILGIKKSSLYYYLSKINTTPGEQFQHVCGSPITKITDPEPGKKEGVIDLNGFPELFNKIKEIAAKEMRTVDQQMMYMLTRAIDYYKLR